MLNSSSIPDALSVTPLAKALNAPILLTNKDGLSSETKTRLSELQAKKIYIIGGENSISKSTEEAFVTSGYEGKESKVKLDTLLLST